MDYNRMNIEIDSEDGYNFAMEALLRLEEEMPDNKKLTKAVKRIAHYLMLPGEWEQAYDQDYVDYNTGEIE
jgi:hypothetical protein